MDTLLVIKWQWPNGASFWSTHNDIGIDGRIRDWPGLRLTPVWAQRLELGAGDDNLLAVILKAGGDLLASGSDNGEIGFGEPETGLLKAREDGVDLTQGGSFSELPHEAISEFLIAENGSVEQLADWATKHGQSVLARLSTLESALRSQVAATTRLASKLGFSEQDIADCTAQSRAALLRTSGPDTVQTANE